ncbi:MAG: winged helix DNA-binding protein [Clostridiales bacterium]|nr:winged helix DNA-binding protein [Clostridiales bacterium]
MSRGLSPLQTRLLGWVAELQATFGEANRLFPGYAPWHPGWWAWRTGEPFTRAQQAAISRAIRRLERRGLVETRRCISDRKPYVMAIRLTEQGWSMVNKVKNDTC